MENQSSMSAVAQQPNFAEMFERVVVPAIFVPWGRDLLDRAQPIQASDRVLDLGCGTGIVARLLRERRGVADGITGLDVQPGMLEVARSIAPDIDWREGTATALPFDAGAFDLVLSQQMLQFVPDRAAAAREILRVLAPGGRVVASTWRPVSEQPLLAAITEVAERHFGPSRDPRHAFGDADALQALFVEAGFTDVRVEVVTRANTTPDAMVRVNIMPMGFDFASLSDEERERRLAAVEAECAPIAARYAVDGGIAAPMSTNVITATSPGKIAG